MKINFISKQEVRISNNTKMILPYTYVPTFFTIEVYDVCDFYDPVVFK